MDKLKKSISSGNTSKSTPLNRLSQQYQFISSYKNLDTDLHKVERQIEEYIVCLTYIDGGLATDGGLPRETTLQKMLLLSEIL